MFNNVTLIGYVGKDGYDLRYSPNGKAVANFKLGVKRPFKNQDGKYDWDNFSIVHWGQVAEWNAESLEANKLALVSGRLQIRSYDTDNGKKWITEIIADTVRCLTPKESMGQEIQFSDSEIPF